MVEVDTTYLWQMPGGVDAKRSLRFDSGLLNQQHSRRYGVYACFGFFVYGKHLIAADFSIN